MRVKTLPEQSPGYYITHHISASKSNCNPLNDVGWSGPTIYLLLFHNSFCDSSNSECHYLQMSRKCFCRFGWREQPDEPLGHYGWLQGHTTQFALCSCTIMERVKDLRRPITARDTIYSPFYVDNDGSWTSIAPFD